MSTLESNTVSIDKLESPASEKEPAYPGEAYDLADSLDGFRQQAAHELGVDSPLFRLVDGALCLWDAPAMRAALRLCQEQWPGEGEPF